MKLEDQCCSLELAKRLKELGVKQDSLCCWDETYNPVWLRTLPERKGTREEECPAAFTVAELGEMLPPYVRGFELEISKDEDVWAIRYFEADASCERESRFGPFEDQSEANTRAAMLFYLLEKGLVTP